MRASRAVTAAAAAFFPTVPACQEIHASLQSAGPGAIDPGARSAGAPPVGVAMIEAAGGAAGAAALFDVRGMALLKWGRVAWQASARARDGRLCDLGTKLN